MKHFILLLNLIAFISCQANDTSDRSARSFSPADPVYSDFQPESYIPENTIPLPYGVETMSRQESSVDKPMYTLPTGFHDFVPSPNDNRPNFLKSSPEGGPHPREGWYFVGKSRSKFENFVDDDSAEHRENPVDLLMYMKAMQQNGQSKKGFLAKLTEDPLKAFLAVSLPLAIVLAGVLPALMNMMVVGTAVPVITSTATGNSSSRSLDAHPSVEVVTTILEGLSSAALRTIQDPDCAAKVICQVILEKSSTNANIISPIVSNIGNFFSGLGLKDLGVERISSALRNRRCDDIACSTSRNVKA